MRERIFGFSLALLLVVGSAFVLNTTSSDNFGLVISAADLNADDTHWTGWMHMYQSKDLVLQVDLTDADSGVTLTARCEGSNVASSDVANSIAADAGHEICAYSLSGGTKTYTCPVSNSLATPGTKKWQWTFENVNSRWVNCLFTSTGDGAADVLTVHAYGLSD